ncbi:hypothetical protein LIN78_05090 [Leeia sp. TBRC 13508]|uniref:DUF1292 domain-containing protein n=1 Tax=Leeia speluncae TaxID=2884804 RepID=A0ABS8D464_9NEIS|nr:hypothetical protein [Leeia speluncae]MCB6182922.1 hypothetical protein [Leeia speluncae]
MKELVFEKVGDVNSTYPYLCVYIQGDNNPFMEIAVNDSSMLELTVYTNERNVVLTTDQWEEILKRAREFLPKALENEDI